MGWNTLQVTRRNKRQWAHNTLTVVFNLLNGHSPSWEANRPSATQEIPPISWNPNINYRYIYI